MFIQMNKKEVKSIIIKETQLKVFLEELEEFEEKCLESLEGPFDELIQAIEKQKTVIKAELYDIQQQLG